jgi:hypothetical protein
MNNKTLHLSHVSLSTKVLVCCYYYVLWNIFHWHFSTYLCRPSMWSVAFKRYKRIFYSKTFSYKLKQKDTSCLWISLQKVEFLKVFKINVGNLPGIVSSHLICPLNLWKLTEGTGRLGKIPYKDKCISDCNEIYMVEVGERIWQKMQHK